MTTAPVETELTARERVRRARPLIIIALIVVAASFVLALVAGRPSAGLLHPAAATPAGSRALAELLTTEGVEITAVETLVDAETQVDQSSTLFVTVPDRMSPERLAALANGAAAVVLVQPTAFALEELLPDVADVGEVDVESREPGCSLPAAQAAGSADAGGVTYETSGSDVQCYAVGGRPSLVRSLVRTPSGDIPITVVGTHAPFTNDRLDEDGNAALALWLLGEQPRLVWYLPAVSDALANGDSSLLDLIPDGWVWAAGQLLLALVLVAIWRARRLGPVVTEPLPVVVPAAEAVEGRGRLYRQAQARDRAADALRDATRARLRQPLGLHRSADSHALVETVARRTGRNDTDVGALLFGAPPQDDEALVRLADELDKLEREVRRR